MMVRSADSHLCLGQTDTCCSCISLSAAVSSQSVCSLSCFRQHFQSL